MKLRPTGSAAPPTSSVAKTATLLGTAAAALLGLGIGVGVGLLLAPASGEETRSNIASKARDIRERVSSRAAATGTFGG